MYDLVSLGEVMLRMSPPKYIRLRNATQLDVHVAGAQLNVAANLARLGKQTAFISKLPDSELGLLALDTCRSYGGAMDYVKLVWATHASPIPMAFFPASATTAARPRRCISKRHAATVARYPSISITANICGPKLPRASAGKNSCLMSMSLSPIDPYPSKFSAFTAPTRTSCASTTNHSAVRWSA